jgi:uncharacterized protein YacL
MSNLFAVHFWFNQRPEPLAQGSERILIGFIILCLVCSVAVQLLKKGRNFYRRLYEKLFVFFIFNALIGAVLFLFSLESIPSLSAHFWYLLWAIGLIVWLSLIGFYLKKLPERKKELLKEKEFNKYLP